jgi:hypothetical protein
VSARAPLAVLGGARSCLEQSFELTGRGVAPYEHYARACASGSEPAAPLLIQAVKPRTAVILDRPASGCGPVHVTASGRRALAASVCSAAKPILRITSLPRAAVVTVAAIAGLSRVSLHVSGGCKHVCERKLGK